MAWAVEISKLATMHLLEVRLKSAHVFQIGFWNRMQQGKSHRTRSTVWDAVSHLSASVPHRNAWLLWDIICFDYGLAVDDRVSEDIAPARGTEGA